MAESTPAKAPQGKKTATAPAELPGATAGRTLILDTAARLFRHKGYAATSLRDIASACGMKAGSLYYHFESKDAIITEVLRIGVAHVFDAIRGAVDKLDEDATARQRIETAVRAHLLALLESEDYTSANIRIFGQVPAAVKAAHLPLRQRYEEYWTELLNQCARAGAFRPDRDLHFARLFLIGAMNSTLEWFDPARAPVESIAAELTEVFMNGLMRDAPTKPKRSAAKKAA